MATFSVTRSANGQVVISLKNVEDYNVNGLGKMKGDAKFSMGHTKGSNETILQMGQTSDAGSLVFEASDADNNLEFFGKNLDVSIKNKETDPYNISWKADDSKFDSSKSKSTVIFQADEESSNNLIKMGASNSKISKFDNLILDNGQNNIYTMDAETTTRVETGAASKGAAVIAGNGANEFYLSGDLGTFIGGSGSDTFITDKATAKKNMMLGKAGADAIADYGENSLFIGGSGVDTAYIYGKYGIANLGFNEVGNFTFGNGSYQSSVFTGESQTDADGKIYKYADILKLRGWTLDGYLSESGIDNNPYYSLIKKEVEESLG